jgi:anti-anti-sigma factor
VAVLDDIRLLREVCGLSGEVDVAVAGAVGEQLLSVATGTMAATVEFDCAELTFIDAAGVTMLLNVAKCSGKQVRLFNLRACCRRVFEVLDLCERFGIGTHPARGPLIRRPLSA